MRHIFLAALCLALALPSYAQQPPPPVQIVQSSQAAPVPDDGIRTEATVIVTGEQPGPGLWLVRKGGHDLWILGTLSPLPAKMQWQAAQVDQVISHAGEVLQEPQIRVDFKDTGFFKSMLLLPSVLGARKNPDGKRLQDIVSPQAYKRWTSLKARYIGSDSGIEKWRPLFAAQELYSHAIKEAGMDTRNQAKDVIAASIEKHHPNVTPVKLTIQLENPKAMIREQIIAGRHGLFRKNHDPHRDRSRRDARARERVGYRRHGSVAEPSFRRSVRGLQGGNFRSRHRPPARLCGCGGAVATQMAGGGGCRAR